MSIEISVVIWTIICFFLLSFLLKTFLFKPLIKFMDERKSRIDEGLEEGQKAKQAKEENARQMEDKVRQTSIEAKQILADAKAVDEKKRSEVLAKAHTDARQAIKNVGAKIGNEETAARTDIENRMPELVAVLTGRLLGDDGAAAGADALIQSCVAAAKEQ